MRSGGKRPDMGHVGLDSWLFTSSLPEEPMAIYLSLCALGRENIENLQGLLEIGSKLMIILRDMIDMMVCHSE